MKQLTNMSKKKFRIGDLAQELQVKKFVIRFWEKEFGLQSDRSEGGQRYYTEDDFRAFNTIKSLLYEQGFTIAGAKLQLQTLLNKPEEPQNITAATKIIEKPVPYIPQDFLNQVKILKEQLILFKKALEL